MQITHVYISPYPDKKFYPGWLTNYPYKRTFRAQNGGALNMKYDGHLVRPITKLFKVFYG